MAKLVSQTEELQYIGINPGSFSDFVGRSNVFVSVPKATK
jgi:hypothetical protein